MFRFLWLGQGGYAFTNGRKTIFLDPYFSNPLGPTRMMLPPADPQTVHPNAIITTHDHDDHLDPGYIQSLDKTGVTFFGPDSCLRHLVQLGVDQAQTVPFHRGDTKVFDSVSLSAVYARHTEDSIGVILECAGKRAHVTGDTEFDDRLGQGIIGIDIMFCCINGKWGNMNADEAVKTALRVQPRLVVPMHYGMFVENTVDPQPFVEKARAAGLQCKTHEPGVWYDVEEFVSLV